MKNREYLAKYNLSILKLNSSFLNAEFAPQDSDRKAAWELYVELITRITTQDLAVEHGDEKTALESVVSLFPLTRDILRRGGPESVVFATFAIAMLNQVVRPFTASWHKPCLVGAFEEAKLSGTNSLACNAVYATSPVHLWSWLVLRTF